MRSCHSASCAGFVASSSRRRAEAKHVVLPGRSRFRLLISATQRLRNLVHQAATRFTETVHRSGLDHRFQRAAIDLVVIDTTAKFDETLDTVPSPRARQ